MAETFLATLQSITILLVIGILGFVLISRRIMAQEVLQSLSRLAIEFALPCLAFYKIITSFSPAAMPSWWKLPLWYLFFVAVTGLTTLLLTPLIAGPGKRREVGAALLYQNGLFVPLVIITEVHGSESSLLVSLFLFTLLLPPFFFSTASFFFRDLSGELRVPWQKIFNPVLVITVLALVLQLTGGDIYMPSFIVATAKMLGNMSVPLLLIILGGTIYLDIKGDGQIEWLTITRFVFVKNLVFPALMLGVVLLLQPERQLAYLLVLQSAVPPITSLPIVAERNGGNRRLINHLLIGSFAAALVTIPLAMAVFAVVH
ncbi:MAG: AEC family transporter [Lentisphaeria bacterium]